MKCWSVLPLIATCGVQVALADRFEPVRESIRREVAEQGLPSLAVAVAQDGKIVWEQGFGWANREQRIAASEHTAYNIASVTKPLTATALMTLVEAGKIDLDRPVNDYLGQAKLVSHVDPRRQATIRHLLTHTSGLPKHFQFLDEGVAVPSKEETIARYGNLVTVPGVDNNYSNLGFGILGYIIERVAGMPFADYMRKAVFTPLGMTHSSIEAAPELEAVTAVRYSNVGNAPLPRYRSDTEGAGSAYSSAHDLLRFAMFHLGEQGLPPVLTPASLDAMHRDYARYYAAGTYGLGWLIGQRPGGYRVVHHNGGSPGVTTHLLTIPSERVAVVLLANRQPFDIEAIADQIFQVLLPKWQAGYLDRASGLVDAALPASVVGMWRGHVHTYQGDIPLTLTFPASGVVRARLQGQPESELKDLKFTTTGKLYGEMSGDLRTPDVNRDGNQYTLELDARLNGDRLTGTLTAFSIGGDRNSKRSALGHWVELKQQPASQ